MDGFKNDIRNDEPQHTTRETGYILLNVGKIARYNQESCHVECIYSLKQHRIVLIYWCQMECNHQQNEDAFQII
jgi:hypothetical protein